MLGRLLNKIYASDASGVTFSILKKNKLNKSIVVNFLNAHAVNLSLKDGCFASALLNSDFLLRDGVGIEFAMTLLGLNKGSNNNGTDFIPFLLKEYGRGRMLILGSDNDKLNRSKIRFHYDFNLEVIGFMNGFDYTSKEYLDFVNEKKPDIILLVMGMPKQEKLSNYLVVNKASPALIISGGAILNFLIGDEVRAPKVFRFCRLEWIWRFLNDPFRLFGRYFMGGFVFIFNLVKFFFMNILK